MDDLLYRISFQQNADNIKTQLCILRMAIHPYFSGLLQESLFGSIYGFFRETEPKMTTGFYFYYDHDIVFQSNAIHLLLTEPPVTVQDRIAKF